MLYVQCECKYICISISVCVYVCMCICLYVCMHSPWRYMFNVMYTNLESPWRFVNQSPMAAEVSNQSTNRQALFLSVLSFSDRRVCVLLIVIKVLCPTRG